ncbi:SDR family NAD(P)-dependent oxidoreductase [Rhizobium leguminosarum]|uniref:Probable oxidoreductase n=1 Tax=Rhizobium ruizarguesonis TaxID=2081791 RepID=A0AB38I5I4_9HYPH|nr:SDR family NAD(P)-dependent oxidoreductase [Rhizobium ruizarguesonis]NEJ25641.1 SDR family NAD(P)-dependent oxidoreductase [Rhizobium leguminosarum]NKK58044.1 SDR family NAD(P)-dependent oxidoreductase [Rhizobium leguminosarum bv. viciae]TBC15174.1 SDR family NAD(P)-dependent oxidoreductase [Rhizobium ruizarguesonis]
MRDKQVPIGSGFGAHTTADEVLAGLDLSGKRVIVTGGHSGLGLETTRALAGAGAQVTIGARSIEAARSAVAGIDGVEIDRLDLSDLESVRVFAERFVASGRSIDILINSAGIMACPETRVGDGWEAQFATNHLGHFALVNRLWPAISRGARIVSVSSGGHGNSAIRWEDVQFETGYDKWQAYGQSKTANALFAVHLDRLGRDTGIRAFSLHPGKIFTPLQRYLAKEEMVGAGWIDADGNPIDPTFKTPSQGAATQVWAATSPQLDGMGGLYCEDCDIAIRAADGEPGGVSDHAADPEEAARLWILSARLTGIDAFAAHA